MLISIGGKRQPLTSVFAGFIGALADLRERFSCVVTREHLSFDQCAECMTKHFMGLLDTGCFAGWRAEANVT